MVINGVLHWKKNEAADSSFTLATIPLNRIRHWIPWAESCGMALASGTSLSLKPSACRCQGCNAFVATLCVILLLNFLIPARGFIKRQIHDSYEDEVQNENMLTKEELLHRPDVQQFIQAVREDFIQKVIVEGMKHAPSLSEAIIEKIEEDVAHQQS